MILATTLGPVRHLAAGACLSSGERHGLWRVRDGLFAPSGEEGPAGRELESLALPGDLLGTQLLSGELPVREVRAVTAGRLEPVTCTSLVLMSRLLTEALIQARRQGRELVRLRSGGVPERVKALLLLLGSDDARDEQVVAMPTLRDMSRIVDSSPESVSRVISSMRRRRIVGDRSPQSATFSRAQLQALVETTGMTCS
jgi:hypothetical protein